MKFTLEPIWSWPAVLLAAVALAALVWFAYMRQSQSLAPERRRWLLSLKLGALAVILFALLRPAVQFSQTDENDVQLLVVTDVSRSMNIPDGPGGKSRFAAARFDIERLSDQWARLGRRMQIRRFEFDRELRPWQENRTEGSGDQSALGQALVDLLREVRQQRTAAILMQSDGAQRAVPPFDEDPLLAARKLAEAQAPVYPLGYGATALSSATADLAVRDLLVNQVVFEKKQVPIRVQLHAHGARGKKAQVRILVEDRGNRRTGESGPLVPAPATQSARPVQEIEFSDEHQTVPVELSFVPEMAGELKVAVEVAPLEGELLTRNNRLETIISVKQGGLRVAYFDVIRSEQRMLRMVNGEDKIQLDFFDVRGGRFRGQTVIDSSWFEPGKYDAYLIGDVPADVFGPRLLALLADRVREGSGLLMTGGLQNFSAGGYANTPLAELLPVVLTAAPPAPGRAPSLQGQLTGPQPVIPTEVGLKRFVMQLASPEKNRARWEALAPLMGATRLEPKHELIEIWAQTRDGSPLLLAAPDIGRSRVAAFGGDTTYQWVLHGQGHDHQRFWRQMILWLARKEADATQSVWVRIDPRNYLPGATVALETGARDEHGVPLSGVEFQVEVTDPNGKVLSVTPRTTANGAAADYTNTLDAGDYWVRVTARKGGQVLGLGAATRFIVDAKDLELDQPNADYELLRQIAEITGGQSLQAEDLEGFLKRLEGLKLEDLTRVTVVPLWDNLWLLGTLVALLTAEWALRKKWGLA